MGVLKPSCNFSTSSAYCSLRERDAISLFRQISRVSLPLEMNNFLWQMIRGRLPIGMEISEKYEPPSNGRFSLYGTQEDVDHISFGGHLARSCGVCMHQMLNCDMSPTNFASFFAILQSRLSPSYRTIWICFTAQSWRFG